MPRIARLLPFVLAVAALSVAACSGHTCPGGGGFATVTLPAAQSGPIAGVSADGPCTATIMATDGGSGEIVVQTSRPATCHVRVELMNGATYTFDVAFEARGIEGCGTYVGRHNASIPEGLDAGGGDAGTLPSVPPGCGATCGTPAGTVQPLGSPADSYAAVRGRWHICGNWPGDLAPAGTVGIEFGPVPTGPADGGTIEGNAYYLVNGPSGPARGDGFGYLLTYRIEATGTAVVIYNGVGGTEASIRYSPCPLELELSLSSPAAILVPFGN